MSEFSLIYQHFQHATKKHTNTTLGIGDDCAVSSVPANSELVSCVDTLVMGRHFPIGTSAYAIGFKAVAVNLSDLASMGATPYAILLGISLPSELANDDFLAELVRGVGDVCGQFGVELIGGDTTGSSVLTLSVTALGFVPKGQAIKRAGANIDDVVCVSGDIGLASVALQAVLQGKNTPLQPALDLPQSQVALGQALRGFASSMIDISDGLGQDLGHILTASKVGAVIELDKIPTHDELNQLPFEQKYQHIINGGDDYQLLFTISLDNLAHFQNKHPNLPIYPIGQIVAGNTLTLCYQGGQVMMSIQGWQHF